MLAHVCECSVKVDVSAFNVLRTGHVQDQFSIIPEEIVIFTSLCFELLLLLFCIILL